MNIFAEQQLSVFLANRHDAIRQKIRANALAGAVELVAKIAVV